MIRDGRYKDSIVTYQFCVLVLYLIAITITTSMKIILPIYIVLSLLPYLSNTKKIEQSTFIIISINLVYLLYGILFQDKTEAVTTFLSKTYQFIAFMLFFAYAKKKQPIIDFDGKKIMLLCIIVESLLGMYLITHAVFVARITAGRQPVGGNISIVVLPIIIYAYFKEKKTRGIIIAYSFVSAIWILLSGTRGYLLLFIMVMLPIYWDYFFSLNKSSRKRILPAFILLFVLFGYVFFLLTTHSDSIQWFTDFLRLDTGIGSRGSENHIALDFFVNTSIKYKLFGTGFGGTPSEVVGYLDAVAANTATSWSYTNYATRVGTAFHNLFSNILLIQGVLGCIMVISIFIWGYKRIHILIELNKTERFCLYMFWIGFFIMNYFRWSCDCGISEMIIFGLVLGIITSENIKVCPSSM